MSGTPGEEEIYSPKRRDLLHATVALAGAAAFGTNIDSTSARTIEEETFEASTGSATKSNAFLEEVSTIPFSSRREYKHIVLPNNGLRVLLASDNQAYSASAALTIGGAGQFQEPSYLGGLAHLMEHIVSCSSTTTGGGGSMVLPNQEDFEDWLADREGASNAFTAPNLVCYHFTGPPSIFPDALSRFSSMLHPSAIEATCRNETVVQREIRRVDDELDLDDDYIQSLYLLKAKALNPEHPFARFTQGSFESLVQIPAEQNISVSDELVRFFRNNYLSNQAVLVLTAPLDLETLERYALQFDNILNPRGIPDEVMPLKLFVPPSLPQRSRALQYILYRYSTADSPLGAQNNEKLWFNWIFDRVYPDPQGGTTPTISTTTLAFFLAQMLDRRGPGSLYLFLLRRGWVPKGNSGLPRVTVPVDTSGFQLLRLELTLTPSGFDNRDAVVAAVCDTIYAISKITKGSGILPEAVLNQYLTMARLRGAIIAPRPPDAIEMAVDAQMYGLGGKNGVGVPGMWPHLPTFDPRAMKELQIEMSTILNTIRDTAKSTIIVTASQQDIARSRQSFIETTLPSVRSSRWKRELVSDARYLEDDMLSLSPGKLEEWAFAKYIDEDELLPPLFNPLIPSRLRPPRPLRQSSSSDGDRQSFFSDEGRWREFSTPKELAEDSSRTTSGSSEEEWSVVQVTHFEKDRPQLILPIMPAEPTPRAAFVVQLNSARAARANVRQAAHAELWLRSFDQAVDDLAELGVPAGLAYDVSFNKFGLRIAFLGISQNIAPYMRRLSLRLVKHSQSLQINARVREMAIADANRQRTLSPVRKFQLGQVLREASAQEAAAEGRAFLGSCSGVLCLAQGDFLPNEVVGIVKELKAIFAEHISRDPSTPQPAQPLVSDIVYKTNWKPTTASLCLIPGMPLVCDACGRVPR